MIDTLGAGMTAVAYAPQLPLSGASIAVVVDIGLR
jgi:hypothetical protein